MTPSDDSSTQGGWENYQDSMSKPSVILTPSRPGQPDGYLYGLIYSYIGKNVVYTCAWFKRNNFIIKFQMENYVALENLNPIECDPLITYFSLKK